MFLCVGIDPSLNSTGICFSEIAEDGSEISRHFNIIHSGKLSKKEKLAEEKFAKFFEYSSFDWISKEEAKELSPSDFEYRKTSKLIEITDILIELIQSYTNSQTYYSGIYICIEGISYGSTHGTKSIFDLAGLNYLIRYRLLRYLKNECTLIIAPPAHIKKFATGKGNANKQMMIESFKLIYPDFDLPKIDDISDAYFMNKYAEQQALSDFI